jgi:hypothetical protein
MCDYGKNKMIIEKQRKQYKRLRPHSARRYKSSVPEAKMVNTMTYTVILIISGISDTFA